MNRTSKAFLYIAAATLAAAPALAFAASSDQFVSLTQVPIFNNVTTAPDLASFLNALYKILIGVAATAAVIQFVRAGVEIMTAQGSFAQNQKAKQHISNAVIGLILVLSPAVILGIINPKILNLKLDFSGIQSTPGSGASAAAPAKTGLEGGAPAPTSKLMADPTKVNTGCKPIADGQIIENQNYVQEQCCANQISIGSNGVTCKVQARSNPDLSQTEYCSCTYNNKKS